MAIFGKKKSSSCCGTGVLVKIEESKESAQQASSASTQQTHQANCTQ